MKYVLKVTKYKETNVSQVKESGMKSSVAKKKSNKMLTGNKKTFISDVPRTLSITLWLAWPA